MSARPLRSLFVWPAVAALLFCLVLCPARAEARPDVADLFVDALLESDVAQLDAVLASNFVFIGSNGHIQDKKHFLESLKTGAIRVRAATFTNTRETSAGPVRLITGNGEFTVESEVGLPSGLMRCTMVTDRAGRAERIVLLQMTPVVPTADCRDGNCRIR